MSEVLQATQALCFVAGTLVGIQGTPGSLRNQEQTQRWLVNTDGFLKGAPAKRLALGVWLRKCVSL